VEAATIPDEMLLPIDASFVQQIQLPIQASPNFRDCHDLNHMEIKIYTLTATNTNTFYQLNFLRV
jgi:hypothetical protein